MSLLKTVIISPDSAHWAKWFDAALGPDGPRRDRALGFHDELIQRGRIPLMTWHQFEELMTVDSDDSARERVGFIQAIPLLAWMRLDKQSAGLASIGHILAAEAIAASEGHNDLMAIRDRARSLLICTGPGREAIGDEGWVWEAVRPQLRARKGRDDFVAAVSPVRTFDENRTIAEICKSEVNSPSESREQLKRIYTRVFNESFTSNGGDSIRARQWAEAFMDMVLPLLPQPGTSPRELLVSLLVAQGIDESEIHDDSVLADLSRLGTFRSQLRTIASETGRSFDDLKRIPMEILPSRVISEALRSHGQKRALRPGGDMHDGHLAVLAAYCDTLYVDKRTAEDFRRARQKELRLDGLIGEIAKAPDFMGLLGSD
jgi:hypothetical protein